MEQMTELFGYGFFIKAFWAVILSGITCSIVGSYIVARRMVFISGGITHASFGGIGLAFFLGFDPLLGAVAAAILAALGIQLFINSGHVREDSSIAIWWALGMAIGIIFVFLTPGYTPNLTSYLFGNILTVTKSELWLMLALSALVTGYFTMFYRKILYIAFDEEFARISGLPVTLFNYLSISLVALTVVLNIRVVGIILILSLLTIPQAMANLITSDFRKMMFLSMCFSIIGSVSGLFISYFLNIPSGASIIFTLVIMFGVLRILKPLYR